MARDTAPQFGVPQDFGKNFHEVIYGLTAANQVIPIKITTDGEIVVSASITPLSPITAVVTRVPSSTSSQILIAANLSRKGLLFYNDGNAQQFIKFGTTASTIDFTVRLTSQSFYEVQTPVYSGRIDVISSNTNGAIQVTELT